MSREVNINDPDSWDDNDRAWLAQRVDMVPADLRHLLTPPTSAVGVVAGINPQMEKLVRFVRENFPERAGEDPVDVVISELGGDVDEEPEESGDDYDQWRVNELEGEAKKRQIDPATFPTGNAARTKQPWIDLLRGWDAEHA